MVPTEALRRELERGGFGALTVVPRGVDTERFTPARRSASLRASWGASPADLMVACVGRLAPEKNLGVLLAAYQAIRAADPRARLLLVGDGPMRAALRGACPDAIFAGQRSGLDLAAHYASADLFVFPSQTETFGNVTTEALASGLPVVAFDHAAAGELIRSGDNGVLVPFGETAAFVARAAALAVDGRLRQQIAPRARASALALGWDRVVASFEAQLATACGTGAQTPRVLRPEALKRPA
jgi:glycosyltransferase involved in cell wall biosynthesis